MAKNKQAQMKTVYYSDEHNDEFSRGVITPIEINGSYKYKRSPIPHFILYRLIAMPLAFLYLKLKFSHKITGGEKLKQAKGTGYFMYGNHTQDIGDALMPALINHPRDTYVIVHPNNVSMKLLGKLTPYLGALPLPDDMTAYKNFLDVIGERIEQKKPVFVYPEAHIWPYCTRIRNFPDTSFYYPIKYGVPVFCSTNVYKKKRHGVRIQTYIDGPFYPDMSLPAVKRKKALRDKIYETMCRRAELNEVELVRYIKKEE